MDNQDKIISFYKKKSSKSIVLENMNCGKEYIEEFMFSTGKQTQNVVNGTTFFRRKTMLATLGLQKVQIDEEIILDIEEVNCFLIEDLPEVNFDSLPSHVKALYLMRF